MSHKYLLSIYVIATFYVSVCYGYPSHKWQHIEDDNFKVSYNSRTAHLAEETIRIAKETKEALGDYFNYGFLNSGKISIVLYDDEDVSNGSASVIWPQVNIYCRKTPFMMWRGEKYWLKCVLTHELTHIYTLHSIKSPFRVLAGTQYDSEPEGIDVGAATYFEHRMMPIWFIEGIAQLGSWGLDADWRDPYREMLLCDSYLNDQLLSMSDMSRFEGTSREYELAYNQGFDLLLYLIAKYRDIRINDVCKNIEDYGFRIGMQTSYSQSLDNLYKEWKSSLYSRFSSYRGEKCNVEDPLYSKLFIKTYKPYIVETMSAHNGKYVVSNWRHDYSRFDLFILDDNLRKVKRTIRDVGPLIKYDSATGLLWFAKKLYNRESGVVNYDLFTLNRHNRRERITYGTRCFTFDAKYGMLVYASYKAGSTYIIKRRLNQPPDTLKSFPYDTSVYNISIKNSDAVILSLGTGKAVNTALLKGDSVTTLWKDVDADIMDAVSYGDSLFFISTIDKTPQLYFCDISRENRTWHKLTSGIAGVRYPTIENTSEGLNLFCSVYRNGNFEVRSIKAPFKAVSSITLPVDSSQTGFSESQQKKLQYYDKTSNILPYKYFFAIEYSSHEYQYSNDTESEKGLNLNFMIIKKNAQETFEVGLIPNIYFPFGKEHVPFVQPSVEVWMDFDLWNIKLSNTYRASRDFFETFYPDSHDINGILTFPAHSNVRRYVGRVINSRIDYELTEKNNLRFEYEYYWQTYRSVYEFIDSKYHFAESNSSELTFDYQTVFNRHKVGLGWQFYSQKSQSDPGRLGSSCLRISSNCYLYDLSFKKEVFNPATYSTDPVFTVNLSSGIAANVLLKSQKMSIKVLVDGFYFLNDGIKDSVYTYGMLTRAGKENYFSGYPWDYLYVASSARLAGEIRFNPFIQIMDNTRWYEMMHFGIKVEAGAIEYFKKGRDSGYPLSGEIAFRYRFYIRPRQESTFYFKYAIPLKEIVNYKPFPPYRIYAGILL